MACCQRHELVAPADEERVAADDERAGLQLRRGSRKRRRSRFRCWPSGHRSCTPFVRAASCTSRIIGLGSRIVRVHEQGDHLGLGSQLGKQLEPLGVQLVVRMLTPVRLPPGRARLATRPARDRVAAADEDDRDRRGRVFRRQRQPVGRSPRLRRPCGRRDRRPMRAADHSVPPPSGIRSPRFGPRRSRFRSIPGGTRPANAAYGPGEVLPR